MLERRIKYLLLPVFFVIFSLNSGAAAVFDPKESKEVISLVPAEYRHRVIAALESAGENWKQLVSVLRNLPSEQREGAAFLIANMPPVELATVDSSLLFENITYAYRAWKQMPWGTKVPPRIFLHFVLPYRVAREPVTKWRKALFEELAPRVKNLKSITEASLELNRWVKEKTSWRTRRLDQVLLAQRGPLEILRSGYGNCEEQTIVYVAAARAVGVPARQAFCWWSTGKGYHAWTEVWDGANWRYLGSGEPAEKLDQTWFSQKTSQMPKVYAYSFAQTPLKTNMLGEQITDLLDITEHYTPPGTLAVKVVKKGEPAPGLPVHVSVYNLGALRSVAQATADQKGQVEFLLGEGKYIVSAGVAEQNTWKPVSLKTTERKEISLDISKPQNFSVINLSIPTDSLNVEK